MAGAIWGLPELSADHAFSLSGKIALVTGAASGIGVGIARVLSDAGATVIVADLNLEGARAVANQLGNAHPLHLDQANEDSVLTARNTVLSDIGVPWILVNNAAVQDRQYIAEETVAGWDRTHAVNARGPFLMIREFGGAMIAAGQGGRIINVASNSIRGMAVKGSSAYIASKCALAMLTGAVALEYAEHGITANTVLPGAVATPGAIAAKGPPTEGPGTRRAPFGLCDPEDIGHAVLYFASPAAHRVTNQTIAVDGGWTVT
jgi:NAD(P)-dependent dehydrogenase (short-subunit alcohol dehydrogenase family)